MTPSPIGCQDVVRLLKIVPSPGTVFRLPEREREERGASIEELSCAFGERPPIYWVRISGPLNPPDPNARTPTESSPLYIALWESEPRGSGISAYRGNELIAPWSRVRMLLDSIYFLLILFLLIGFISLYQLLSNAKCHPPFIYYTYIYLLRLSFLLYIWV